MTVFPASKIKEYVDWQWPHFNPKEFACKCCGNLLVTKESADAWDKIEEFRKVVKVPVIINSAYRCEKHNEEIGGAKNSNHLKGIAFDVRITDRLSRKSIYDAAEKVGFKGFGDYKNFVHVDTGKARKWNG